MPSTAHKLQPGVDVVVGDMFESPAQTLVNTVNTVGVMGKGVALEFKRRFPEMFADYRRRCQRGEVWLGRPYLYERPTPPHVLNFPTKAHWRAVSRLKDIVQGLEHLEQHYQEWGITSLAVPPLGCGQGGLDWSVVGPTLFQHLSRLRIPVQLFAPHGTPHGELEPRYLQRSLASVSSSDITGVDAPLRLEPGWIALVAVLEHLQRDPHHWPVGKTTFQKLAYFATAAGVSTGLEFERGSYGPFSKDVAKVMTRLVNNDLLTQEKLGRMVAHRVGPTYAAASRTHGSELARWDPAIGRVADLLARLRTTRSAEVAASVHFAAATIRASTGGPPDERSVLEAVLAWKDAMRPPLEADEILLAMRSLAMLRWLELLPSQDLPSDELALVGIEDDDCELALF
jgi:O-acetyl-ADP-ribose deacetylase (regulator of RNase III)